MVQIGAEKIRYRKRIRNELRTVERGVLDTSPIAHAAGAEGRQGSGLVAEVMPKSEREPLKLRGLTEGSIEVAAKQGRDPTLLFSPAEPVHDKLDKRCPGRPEAGRQVNVQDVEAADHDGVDYTLISLAAVNHTRPGDLPHQIRRIKYLRIFKGLP